MISLDYEEVTETLTAALQTIMLSEVSPNSFIIIPFAIKPPFTTSIVFSPKGISREVFRHLQSIELDNLCLIGSDSLVNDDVMDLISSMKLKSLNLQGCNITNACLPYLKRMTTLESLALDKKVFSSEEEFEDFQKALPATRLCIWNPHTVPSGRSNQSHFREA